MLRTTPMWAGQAFGSSLKDLARAGQAPHVLLDSLRFLASRGLTTPCLFSSPVNKRQLLALKEAYDAGRRALRSARVANNLDPVAAANLLLLWLGALSEPLFPPEHVPELLQVYTNTETTRSQKITCMRSLLKRTEPFIVEALFPLFELLHHYWINQPQREATLTELATIFAAPVFGIPSEHNVPPETASILADAAALLIAEYRPLFTQPYNLQRYEADLARQATAAEAKQSAAEARAHEQAALRALPLRINASPASCSSGELSTSPSELSDLGSPLLTPRRMVNLSVMGPMEPLFGCSPEEGSLWFNLLTASSPAAGSDRSGAPMAIEEEGDAAKYEEMEAMLDSMLQSTVSAAFSSKSAAAAAQTLGYDDRKYSPISVVMDADTSASVPSSYDVSREASDSDAELPNAEALVAACCAALPKRGTQQTAAVF